MTATEGLEIRLDFKSVASGLNVFLSLNGLTMDTRNPHHSLETEAIRYDESYKQELLYRLDNKSDWIFENSSAMHAAIIYQVFFERAVSHVRIFCQNLCGNVFGQKFVTEAAASALARGVSISVITEDAPQDSPFLKLLQNPEYSKRVYVGILKHQEAYNYAVMDDCAIRWENEKSELKAVGRMYDLENAKRLITHFDDKLLPKAAVC